MKVVAGMTVDPAAWSPITPDRNFDHFIVANQGNAVLRLRLDPADPTTEIVIPAMTSQMIAAPRWRGFGQEDYRFTAGRTAFYLRSDAGTGPAMIIWA